MSSVRFLADQDFDERILNGVIGRDVAVSVTRLREVGLSRADDDRVLEYAAEQGQVVLSHDENTMTAAAYTRTRRRLAMRGLLIARQQKPMRDVIDSILLVAHASEAEEWVDRVEFL